MARTERARYVGRIASAATFNTLDVTRRLKSSGFTEQQAGGIADMLAKDAMVEVATKSDLRELEQRLTIRVGIMMAGLATIILAGFKLIV